MHAARLFEGLWYDARYAVRSLMRAPGFAVVTIITLALATGATTAIFSIVNGVLLRPLPFAAPDRLVQVEEVAQIGGPGAVLVGDVEEFRAHSRTLETLSAYSLTTRHLQGTGEPERLTTVVVDQHFFSLLGVQPLLGRTPGPADVAAVVVIGERLWERRFNRDPSVIARSIVLDGNVFDPVLRRTVIQRREHTVVGVMPARFQFPYAAASVYATALPETQIDLWILNDQPYRGGRVPVTARLRAGATAEQALSELTVIEQRLDQLQPSEGRPMAVRIVPLVDEVVGPVRRSLWLLMAAVALVLVAACANVANLLLARTGQRAREIVTRAALGAGQARLMRQLFTESVLLSLAGGVLGMLVAWWGLRVLIALGAAKIPRAHEITLDWSAFAFMMAISIATSAMFGLAPAVSASRTDVYSVTKEASGHATTNKNHGRIRDALVIAEIALAFVLALGAAMVMRELQRLQQQDPGFTIDNVLTLHITPRLEESQYYRLEERIAQLPGVESAGLIHMLPLQNWGGIGTFQVRGRAPESLAQMPTAELRSVTPRYFETLGIAIRRGRGLSEQDRLAQPRPIVINETLARKYFPGEDPIGRALDRGVIVGVVADVRQRHLDETVMPQIYSSIDTSSGIASDIGVALVSRTRLGPTTLVEGIRAAIHELQPSVAIFNIKTMREIVDESTWELNLYRWLIGLFAALALAITAIGLFGVISYRAAARSREFAIRLALGSDQSRLARVVLLRAIALAAIGLAVGGVASLAMIRMLAGVTLASRPDSFSVASICALLLLIALAACLLPALRVARLDPVQELRQQ